MIRTVKILFFLFLSIGQTGVKSYRREFALIVKKYASLQDNIAVKTPPAITPRNTLISFSFKASGVHKSLVTLSP